MRIEHDLLADTLLLKSPGWARVGLTAPSARLRRDAAEELARVILDTMDQTVVSPHPDQLGLPV